MFGNQVKAREHRLDSQLAQSFHRVAGFPPVNCLQS